jgi:hypothetical protein
MKIIQNAKYNNDKSKLLVEFNDDSKDELDVVDNSIIFDGGKCFIIDKDNQTEQIEKRLKTGDFNNCIFLTSANFGGVTFAEYADFWSVTFTEEADFMDVIFTKGADFWGATFIESAYFEGATFTEDAYFRDVIFTKGAYFRSATFNKDAYFRDAIFTKGADFRSATFAKGVYFLSATLKKNISFELAKIIEILSFAGVKFEDSAEKYINLDLKFTQVERIEYGNAEFRADNRETFLTLKNVALKQNDKIKALDFHKQEYETHYQNLNWKQFDKWILGFENSISKFGTSVVDSVCWFVIATIFFYMLMLISTNTITDMGKFIMFFSPTNYKVDTIFNTINWFSGGVFLTYKILQLVLIYEIIKSFRKFSRNL